MPALFSQTLHRVALAGAHVFAWIFIFQYFYIERVDTALALGATALAYALSQIVAVLLTPTSGMRIRNGIRRVMVSAALSGALACTALGLSLSGLLGGVEWGILFFSLFMGAYRAFFWIPYEVDRVSGNAGGNEFLLALVPAAVGILLVSGLSPSLLLYAAAAFLLLSILPTLQSPERHEGYIWRYRETFHQLFSRENRPALLVSVCDGIEGAALLLVWPISVFLLLDWSYGLLGIVLTVTLLSAMVIRMILHRLRLDAMPAFVLAALTGSAWIMRLLVASPLGVVLVDTYFHAGKTKSRAIDMAAHQQAAENNTYVDEYTALKEMGMGMGRALLCITAAIAASYGSFAAAVVVVFVVAAAAGIVSVYAAKSARIARV